MNFLGKSVLVTGGSTGIGRALAIELVGRGGKVSVCGRDASTLRVLAENHPSIHVIQSDVSRHEDRKELISNLVSNVGHLDILVNNAGIQRQIDLRRESLDDLTQEIAVNLNAPILLTQLAMPYLLASSDGCIINITSALALVPKVSAPIYCASKAGLSSYTRSLRAHLGDTNIRVVEVIPPIVGTSMSDGRSAMPVDVFIGELIRGLESDSTDITIGKSRLLKWLHRVSPALATYLINKAD